MSSELLLALGIPPAYLLISTAILLRGDLELHLFVQRLDSRDALLCNTMVAITIAVGALPESAEFDPIMPPFRSES